MMEAPGGRRYGAMIIGNPITATRVRVWATWAETVSSVIFKI